MEKILRGLPYFLEVARQRSFSRAAELLDVPLPSLSRRIAALEKELGVKLLNRTTRSVSLTESGVLFYEGGDFILSELDLLRERIVQNETRATGRVRVSVPTDIYYRFLQGVFGEFTRRHPGVELVVLFTPRWVDLHTEPFDLELRVGPLPDSSLRVRKLATLSSNLYASAEFVRCHPIPEKPQDLARLPFIWLYQLDHSRLDLIRGTTLESVIIRPVHRVSSFALGLELMRAGQGVMWLEKEMAKELEEGGSVVRLLPEWHTQPVDMNIVMASDKVPQRIRLFIEYLAAHFAEITRP